MSQAVDWTRPGAMHRLTAVPGRISLGPDVNEIEAAGRPPQDAPDPASGENLGGTPMGGTSMRPSMKHLWRVLAAGTFAAVLAMGSMGSSCEPPGGGPDGGTGGDGGGGGGGCRDTGTCTPNAYKDDDAGDYDTSNYPLLFLDTNDDGVPDTPSNKNGVIPLIDAYANDQPIKYWLATTVDENGRPGDIFADVGTIPVHRVYRFFEGTVELGTPVLSAPPDAATYSPFYQEVIVDLPPNGGYVPDTMKAEATILAAAADAATGIFLEYTNRVWVIEVVDPSVTLEQNTQPQSLKRYWFNGFTVQGYPLPGGNTDGTIPIASTSDDPRTVPPEPFLSNVLQFKEESGPLCGGRNVYQANLGDPEYTPVPIRTGFLVPDCTTVPTNYEDALAQNYSPNLNLPDAILILPIAP